MQARNRRPVLRVELDDLGPVDPFRLSLVEKPDGSGEFALEDPDQRGRRIPLEVAGLNLVGAAQAMMSLSGRWLCRAGRDSMPPCEFPVGEMRLVVRRREARLLAALLTRHLNRLPEPPGWMGELREALEQVDQFLRWDEL